MSELVRSVRRWRFCVMGGRCWGAAIAQQEKDIPSGKSDPCPEEGSVLHSDPAPDQRKADNEGNDRYSVQI